MERFSLEKYLKNPNREIVYGEERRPVRIFCTNLKGTSHPVVAALTSVIRGKETEEIYRFRPDGASSVMDGVLYFNAEKRYITLWKFGEDGEWIAGGEIYRTADEANEAVQDKFDGFVSSVPVSVKTVQIEI